VHVRVVCAVSWRSGVDWGRPVSIRTEENNEEVRNLVNENRKITTRMNTDMLNIIKKRLATFWKIIYGFVRLLCRTVWPRSKKKSTVVVVSLNLLRTMLTFWSESWRTTRVCAFSTTWRRKDKAWSGDRRTHPGRRRIRLQKSGVKTMLIVFFDIRGIIHTEFVPQGTTVNSHYY
jgi:hypothetical protein